jgi:hypothetical protein
MRLIEFRVTDALRLNERDVPTAICKGLGKNMDPEYVLPSGESPHRLNVNEGSARKEIKLTMPFCNTRNGVSAVDPNIISVTPDDDEKTLKMTGVNLCFFVQSIYQLQKNIFCWKKHLLA